MSKRKTTSEFINEAISVHGNLYSYENVNYVNGTTKVNIVCPTHGSFMQSPVCHVAQKSKCPECCGKKKKTTESFINDAIRVHNNKYLYDNVNYINNKIKVDITCPEHGDYKQLPSFHLQGQGCPRCYGNAKISKEEFYKKVKEIHEEKYEYFDDYVKMRQKIKIKCPKHGIFNQLAMSHYSGHGCQRCAKAGFDKSLPSFLYVQEITKDDLIIAYKFGITNKEPNERMKKQSYSTSLKQKLYFTHEDNGDNIYLIEQNLKKIMKTSYLPKGEFPDGYTETISPNDLTMLMMNIRDLIKSGTTDH